MARTSEGLFDLLAELGASPRLIAHSRFVYEAAEALVVGMAAAWPQMPLDARAVLVGAATHDVGKVLYPRELIGPGRRHEAVGPDILVARGFSGTDARFARTHGRWSGEDVAMEDLVVALADQLWKGTRNKYLELRLVARIAERSGEQQWETFMKLDDIAVEITRDAEARVERIGEYPT